MSQRTQISDSSEFLRLLELSNILTREQMEQAREISEQTSDVKVLARRMMAKDLLTRWQVGQLLAGWHKLRLGRYKLCRQIARGLLGRVFLARHCQLDREVAIKTLSRRFTQNEQVVRRFLDEARRIAALDHRNVLHIYDVDQDDDQYYLVTEYVDGDDLIRLVEQEGPQAFDVVADIMRQIAAGLEYVHQQGLLHQDLRPANVMVDQQGTVKILGLGFGRIVEQSRLAAATKKTDGDCGRFECLAPEQINGDQTIDAKSDLFSAGCCAYWLMTGRCPFAASSLEGLKEAHETQPPPGIQRLRSDAPDQLVAVIEKMMAIRPDDRFSSASEVVDAIDSWSRRNAPKATGSEPNATDASQELIEPDASIPVDDASHGDTSVTRVRNMPPPREMSPADEVDGDVRNGIGMVKRYAILIAAAAGLLIVGAVAMWAFMASGDDESAALAKAAKADRQRSTRRRVLERKPPTVRSTMPKPGEMLPEPAAPDPPVGNTPQANRANTPAKTPADAEPPKAGKDAKKNPSKGTEPKEKSEPKKTPKPKPKPKPRRNPLSRLPAITALPLPADAQEAGGDSMDLGSLHLEKNDPLNLVLLGADGAIPGKGIFRLRPSGDRDVHAWQIQIAESPDSTPRTVARLSVDGDKLVLRWEPAASKEAHAGNFANCVLRFQSGMNKHDLVLRKSQHIDPLLVNLRKVAVDKSIKVLNPPDAKAVRFQVVSLEDPFPEGYVVSPSQPVPPGQVPVWITLGKDPSEQVIKLELVPIWRRSFQLKCSAYFQFNSEQKPEPLTKKSLILADRVITQNQLVQNAATMQKRAEVQKLGRQNPRRKTKLNELKMSEAKLAKVAAVTQKLENIKELKEALKDGGPIHFRVFLLAGDCKVELLTTAVDEL